MAYFVGMTTIKIDDAEKGLAELIKRARQGEEIVISDGDGQDIKLAPIESMRSRRGFGILKGKIKVSDEDLFGPLPEDELKRWHGEGE